MAYQTLISSSNTGYPTTAIPKVREPLQIQRESQEDRLSRMRMLGDTESVWQGCTGREDSVVQHGSLDVRKPSEVCHLLEHSSLLHRLLRSVLVLYMRGEREEDVDRW